MNRTESQNKLIKQHLEKGFGISAAYAYNKLGCLRLASRIYDLKNEGLNIVDEWAEYDGKRFKRYFLKIAS